MSHGAHSTSQPPSTSSGGGDPTKGRWLIVAGALLLQLALGGVYAWSVFSGELQDGAFGLSKGGAGLPCEVAIGMIFLGTYTGGRIQDKRGPRVVALVGGVVYSLGVIVAPFPDRPDEPGTLVTRYGGTSGSARA